MHGSFHRLSGLDGQARIFKENVEGKILKYIEKVAASQSMSFTLFLISNESIGFMDVKYNFFYWSSGQFLLFVGRKNNSVRRIFCDPYFGRSIFASKGLSGVEFLAPFHFEETYFFFYKIFDFIGWFGIFDIVLWFWVESANFIMYQTFSYLLTDTRYISLNMLLRRWTCDEMASG
jgi:hypothetical protein